MGSKNNSTNKYIHKIHLRMFNKIESQSTEVGKRALLAIQRAIRNRFRKYTENNSERTLAHLLGQCISLNNIYI